MLPIRTILHPTDFSEHSDYAFRLACALARDYGARLILLHVATPTGMVYSEGIIPPEPFDSREELHTRLLQMNPRYSEVRTEHLLTDGDAVGEIVRVAKTDKCDVIVMGTHGRTGLGRLLMGSVAEAVLRKAPCPVLLTKSAAQEAPKREPALASSALP